MDIGIYMKSSHKAGFYDRFRKVVDQLISFNNEVIVKGKQDYIETDKNKYTLIMSSCGLRGYRFDKIYHDDNFLDFEIKSILIPSIINLDIEKPSEFIEEFQEVYE